MSTTIKKPKLNKSKPVAKTNGGMINFYELSDVQSFMPTYHNPTYNIDTQLIKHPVMAVCPGTSRRQPFRRHGH